MDIREAEKRTGLERANIRYYETEGLISPERRPNGYRDYSDEDVRTLLKIKLLRMLQVPITSIRALQEDSVPMDSVLKERLAAIDSERHALDVRETICRRMRDDHAEYATLDPMWYLRLAEETRGDPRASARTDALSEESVIIRDRTVPAPHPFRRWFARILDLALIQGFLTVLIHGILRVRVPLDPVLSVLESTALVLAGFAGALLIEPLLLSRFGRTPAKQLLGITVRHISGRFLTRAEAFDRTRTLVWEGMAWGIPVLRQIRMIRNFRRYGSEHEDLPWDYESEVEFRNLDIRHGLAYAGAAALLLFITGVSQLYSMQPGHRGDLTLAQFAANYNEMQDYMFPSEKEKIFRMDAAGELELVPNPSYVNGVNVISFMQSSPPQIRYETVGGRISSVTMEWEEKKDWFPMVPQEGMCAAHALMGAQDAAPWIGGATRLTGLVSQTDGIREDGLQRDFMFGRYRMEVDCRTEGYQPVGGSAWVPTGNGGRILYRIRISRFR